MILANVTIPLVGIVDTAVMGRMPDSSYIGAVAIGATIFSSIYWLFGFLRMATTGLAAQAIGRKDPDELYRIAIRGMGLALGISLVILLLSRPIETLMFLLFQTSDQAAEFAADYFSIRIWGAPALMIYMVCQGVLFGTQRMRTTLFLSILLNVTNVILNLTFVLGFGWGVAGVAAATLISEWLAAGASLILVLRLLNPNGSTSGRLAGLWQGQAVQAMFSVSGNLIIRSFFVQLPFFVFTAVGARFGDVTLAANAVLMQFFFVMAFGLDGFAHTAETLSGYAYGARDRPGLRRAVRYSLLWASGFSLLIVAVYAVAGPRLISLLTTLPEVQDMAAVYLPWAVITPAVAVTAFHFDGVFIGTTRTAELRNSMFIAALIFGIVLWTCIDTLGNHGLWLAMIVFLGLRGVLLAVQYPALERRAAQPTTAKPA